LQIDAFQKIADDFFSGWLDLAQKGGGRGEQSKILAIAQWLMRVMMWRTGEGDHYFKFS